MAIKTTFNFCGLPSDIGLSVDEVDGRLMKAEPKRYRVMDMSDNYVFSDRFSCHYDALQFAEELAKVHVGNPGFAVVYIDSMTYAQAQDPIVHTDYVW